MTLDLGEIDTVQKLHVEWDILTIRYDSRLEDQLAANSDVFGVGNQAVKG